MSTSNNPDSDSPELGRDSEIEPRKAAAELSMQAGALLADCLQQFVTNGYLEIRVTPRAIEDAAFGPFVNSDGTFDLERYIKEEIA
jgi:hypothetical protein